MNLPPLVLAALVAITPCTVPSSIGAPGEESKLWPHEVPGDADFKPPAPNPKSAPPKDDGTMRIALVTEPTLTLFRAPADKANGAAVLICPGGGYGILAWDKEGTETPSG